MTKPQYRITMNAYFYDDNGAYSNQEGTAIVDAQRLEWYKAHDAKPMETGDIFYILDIKKLS